MTDTPEEQQASARIATSITEAKDTIKSASASPARSDKSSDSEGKNVREKLKDTQIDTQPKPDAIRSVDQLMDEAQNGSAKIGEQSVSGSDSERGRLRRKRSREDFEDEAEADKQPEKKMERHSRKRSRDITKDLEVAAPVKPTSTTISSIKEVDADEQMASPNKTAAAAATADKASGAETSPKNKRTRDQIENDNEAATETLEGASANGKPVDKAQGEERNTKRLRDKEGDKSTTDIPDSKTKVCYLADLHHNETNLCPRYPREAGLLISPHHPPSPPWPPNLPRQCFLINPRHYRRRLMTSLNHQVLEASPPQLLLRSVDSPVPSQAPAHPLVRAVAANCLLLLEAQLPPHQPVVVSADLEVLVYRALVEVPLVDRWAAVSVVLVGPSQELPLLRLVATLRSRV